MTSKIHLEATIPEELANIRLDQALVGMFSDYSRARLQNWIKSGHVLVDSKKMRPKDKVFGGEQVIIDAELVEEESWVAQPLDLNIVYEDEQILVVNKPAGLVVHPAAGNPDRTLVNALLHHFPDLNLLPRAGIVHRIDKETTGLLVVAKTLTAHKYLVEQLQEHTMQREYDAVVFGVLPAGGTVNAPIDRHPHARVKMAVVKTGKPAVTHYRVIQRFAEHTWIKCQLETGRTHQIRVHMAHINHPLLGDPVYGGRFRTPKSCDENLLKVLKNFRRQALHAKLLGLVHPTSDEDMVWTADLPNDMQKLIEVLDAHHTRLASAK